MLAAIIQAEIDRAALVGWRTSGRIYVEGRRLVIGWHAHTGGLTKVEDGDVSDLDLRDMPAGVSALEWSAPPDSVIDLHHAPNRDEALEAARWLGRDCEQLDRSDGVTIWRMVETPVQTEERRAWLLGTDLRSGHS